MYYKELKLLHAYKTVTKVINGEMLDIFDLHSIKDIFENIS